MSKKITLGITLVLLVSAVIFGCGRVVTPGGVTPVPQTYGVIMGTVKTTGGAAIDAVTVTYSTSASATNAQGWFSVSNLTATTKEVLTFSKTGYVSTQKVTPVSTGEAIFINVVMMAAKSSQNLSAAAGGSISSQTSTGLTATVSIPANALVDSNGTAFTGTASVTLTPYDPTVTGEISAFPGDFEGVNTSGVTQQFKSFGFMDVTITGGGGDLNLATGQTATIIIPVPASMTTEAAAAGTCPIWFYNTTTAQWIQEGSGTYDSSIPAFVGSVSHFSAWNFDLVFERAYISGRVVDSQGNPVLGAQVVCNGSGWSRTNWESGETSTGTDGIFTRIPVESGASFNCRAEKGGKQGTNYSFGSYAANSETNVGDIVIDSPVVQFTLSWAQDPTDLDSHLTIPTTTTTSLGAERGHLWYLYTVDKGYGYLATQYPYAILDTDDVTSYGPEVCSIYRLLEGTYRFSIHHFTGTGTISDSNANLNIIISGGGSSGIYNFTPPAGAIGLNDVWRVCDIVVDSSGNITSIDPIGDYLHDISASSSEAFSPAGTSTYRGPAQGLSVSSFMLKKK
jgi:uncharacterized protein YfaP (DUF2135 family)